MGDKPIVEIRAVNQIRVWLEKNDDNKIIVKEEAYAYRIEFRREGEDSWNAVNVIEERPDPVAEEELE